MFQAQELIEKAIIKALIDLYQFDVTQVVVQKTRPEFEGDFTVVTFQFVKALKKSPDDLAKDLGQYLLKHESQIKSFNVIKGYLNLVLHQSFWFNYFASTQNNTRIGFVTKKSDARQVMLEYSSPNTNKPLHLGHLKPMAMM
jgi:arginyl-tRNA synthetase